MKKKYLVLLFVSLILLISGKRTEAQIAGMQQCDTVVMMYSPGLLRTPGGLAGAQDTEGTLYTGIREILEEKGYKIEFYDMASEYNTEINLFGIPFTRIFDIVNSLRAPAPRKDAKDKIDSLHEADKCILMFGISNGAAFMTFLLDRDLDLYTYPDAYAIGFGIPGPYHIDNAADSDPRMLHRDHSYDWLANEILYWGTSDAQWLTLVTNAVVWKVPTVGHSYTWGGTVSGEGPNPDYQALIGLPNPIDANFDWIPPLVRDWLDEKFPDLGTVEYRTSTTLPPYLDYWCEEGGVHEDDCCMATDDFPMVFPRDTYYKIDDKCYYCSPTGEWEGPVDITEDFSC